MLLCKWMQMMKVPNFSFKVASFVYQQKCHCPPQLQRTRFGTAYHATHWRAKRDRSEGTAICCPQLTQFVLFTLIKLTIQVIQVAHQASGPKCSSSYVSLLTFNPENHSAQVLLCMIFRSFVVRYSPWTLPGCYKGTVEPVRKPYVKKNIPYAVCK